MNAATGVTTAENRMHNLFAVSRVLKLSAPLQPIPSTEELKVSRLQMSKKGHLHNTTPGVIH